MVNKAKLLSLVNKAYLYLLSTWTKVGSMNTEELLSLSGQHPILLFDGVCNLCDGFVQFIMKRDKKAAFRFAPLQSEAGSLLLEHFDLKSGEVDSVVLIENGVANIRSTAALRAGKRLGGLWILPYAFMVIPPFIRDAVYKFIANNRYKWFGKKDSCMIPSPEVRSRFLS